MMEQRNFKIFFGFLLLLSSAVARADDVYSSFNVTATVQSQCSVIANDLNFGTYYINTPSYANSSIQVNCSPGVYYKVGLSSGASRDFQDRYMTGSGILYYYIHKPNDFDGTVDSGYNWGSIADQLPYYYQGTGNGDTQTLTTFGGIVSQVANYGSYSDHIDVDVNFSPT